MTVGIILAVAVLVLIADLAYGKGAPRRPSRAEVNARRAAMLRARAADNARRRAELAELRKCPMCTANEPPDPTVDRHRAFADYNWGGPVR